MGVRNLFPKQFGGIDEENNLFLMCVECHDKAPNTKSRDAFLQWAGKQNYNKDLQEIIMQEIRNFELEDKIELINDLIRNKSHISNLGIHFNQSRGGAKITISTVFAALSEYEKMKKKSN